MRSGSWRRSAAIFPGIQRQPDRRATGFIPVAEGGDSTKLASLRVAPWRPARPLVAEEGDSTRRAGRVGFRFGSAATERFVPESSALDCVVSFAQRPASGDYADRYLDFAAVLERLFQRRVDLVSEPSIRNPYYCRGNEETRQRMYEQAGASSKTICLS